MPANLFEVASTAATDITKGYGSTGKGALHQKHTCRCPCGTCGTATQDTFHPQDLRLIAEATDKMKKKRGPIDASVVHHSSAPDGVEPVSAMSALSTFKTPKQRHVGKSARSGVADRRPMPPDSNPWKMLLDARRGYTYAVRVLDKILGLFRRAGSQPEEGSSAEPLSNRALVLLFQ